MTLLQVDGATVKFGSIKALDSVSLAVEEGEIVAVLGANGAGKSTLLKAISGLVTFLEGDIRFEGKSVRGMRADAISKMGIGHVPEGRRIFPGLTVRENLIVATAARSTRNGVEQDIERVVELFPVLSHRGEQQGWSLSGGEQQMLAIARALMARPRLLMLDEPSLGLAPRLVNDVLRKVRSIRDEGTTVLLVEQNAKAALRISDRAYAFRNGRVVFEGEVAELSAREDMKSAYLGA